MLWLPAESVLVLNLAVVPLIVAVPSVLVPSLKVTVPVAPLVTVAVKVTLLLKVLGLAELDSVVVLGWHRDAVASTDGDNIAIMKVLVTVLIVG